ncbi:MAG TPA: IS200/IS605 family transposase [Candidatus Nanoarchaeia archaeon]|nr:IS200/IS605 family transposase [Candidatus Nanoarchaeia archaeon]
MEYTRHAHSVGDNFWHIEWCPKYRYNIFEKFKYKNLAEACIRKVAKEHSLVIHELQVMPDHLHCVVSIPDTMSISEATRLLKGRSSYLFFRNHEKARLRYPQGHLWSVGTFRTSVGHSDLPTTLRYVREQQEYHAVASPA